MKSAQAQPSHTPDNHAEDFNDDRYGERYCDRSFDHVARVRAAKEAAQRKMEEFGDISEYDVTILSGQLKEESEDVVAQPSLDFDRGGRELMRLDIPQELPRRHAPEAPRSAPPLEAGPLESRREHLAEIREVRQMPNIPRPTKSPDMSQPIRRIDRPHRHSLNQPTERRVRRNEIPQQIVGLSMREEERKALAEIGKFRVVATRDLANSVYNGNYSQLQRDLRFLEQKGMVEVNAVNARRDGHGGKTERIEVVALTREGRDVARRIAGLQDDQRIYAGMVKPREVEHDAQIYRAYRKQAERIESNGGTNLRVRLDFELKSDVQKAIHASRRANPERDMTEIKREVAERFDLPFVNDGIQIPDARIVYDLEQNADEIGQGSRSGHEDIEVLTAAYSAGHLRAKAQSGFNLYAASSDRSSITAKVEHDHHLIENILEL